MLTKLVILTAPTKQGKINWAWLAEYLPRYLTVFKAERSDLPAPQLTCALLKCGMFTNFDAESFREIYARNLFWSAVRKFLAFDQASVNQF